MRGEPTTQQLFDLVFERWADHTLRFGFIPAVIAVGWFAYAYVGHSRLIRQATGAVAISRTLDARLYNLVENLTITAGMPMPRIEIMDTPALNAYASGLSPASATVAVTRGLLEALNDDELEAVLAHELTHIRNRDVRLMVVATIFVGILGYVSYVLIHQTSRVIGRAAGGAGALLVVVGVAIAAFAGFFGVLTRFALSRSREFMADAGSAELTKRPEALISALRKIEGHDEIDDLPPQMQAMMISARIEGLFATHPSVDARVDALERFAGATPVVGPVRQRPATATARPQAAAALQAAPSFGRRGVAPAAVAAAPAQRSFGRRER
jgi:heat shock protein HtpX